MSASDRSFVRLRRLVLCTALVCGGAIVGGAGGKFALDKSSDRYLTCLSQIDTDPSAAFDQANAWRRQDGSAAAHHCEALALIELRSFRAGASILTRLAKDPNTGDINDRAALYGQAGNAWILEHKPDRALGSFDAALALSPASPRIKVEILIDRGRAFALKNDWPSAEREYTAALDILPQYLEAVVLRAGARRHLNDPVGALADIEFALAIEPENVDVIAERGLLRKHLNDRKGARKDFEFVIGRAPDSAAAGIARNGLAKLSIRGTDD